MRQPRTWEAFSHYRSKIRHRLRRWRIWRGELPHDEELDLAVDRSFEEVAPRTDVDGRSHDRQSAVAIARCQRESGARY
jgi:hypothetical protein